MDHTRRPATVDKHKEPEEPVSETLISKEAGSERRLKLQHLYAGLAAYVGVSIALLVYCFNTWSQPHRPLILIIGLLALAQVPVIWWLRQRIIDSRFRQTFFVVWNLISYLLILPLCLLDGGANSPLMLAWYLPIVYLSLGYTTRLIIYCGSVCIVMFLLVAWNTPAPFPTMLFTLQLILLLDCLLLILLGSSSREKRDAYLAQLRDKLEVLATTDSLTGCLNHRTFTQTIARETRRAARFHRNISFLAVDVDHFKRINDECGHLAGDVLLEKLGQLMREVVRETDLAGRLGGDEFGVLCPETDRDEAIRIAERLRTAFQELPVEVGTTLSIGICTLCPTSETPDLLRQLADAALYEAKKQGRNCLVTASH